MFIFQWSNFSHNTKNLKNALKTSKMPHLVWTPQMHKCIHKCKPCPNKMLWLQHGVLQTHKKKNANSLNSEP